MKEMKGINKISQSDKGWWSLIAVLGLNKSKLFQLKPFLTYS